MAPYHYHPPLLGYRHGAGKLKPRTRFSPDHDVGPFDGRDADSLRNEYSFSSVRAARPSACAHCGSADVTRGRVVHTRLPRRCTGVADQRAAAHCSEGPRRRALAIRSRCLELWQKGAPQPPAPPMRACPPTTAARGFTSAAARACRPACVFSSWFSLAAASGSRDIGSIGGVVNGCRIRSQSIAQRPGSRRTKAHRRSLRVAIITSTIQFSVSSANNINCINHLSSLF